MASTVSGILFTKNGDDVDAILYQGKTVSFYAVLKDEDGVAVDVTGYSAKFQARETAASATAVIDWTSANGKIAVGTVDGKFTVSVSATDTAAIAAMRGGYEFEVTSGAGAVKTLISGKMTVIAEYAR